MVKLPSMVKLPPGGPYRKLGYPLAIVIFLVDQFAKWFVTHPMQLEQRQVIDLLPIFRLSWVPNHGVSMGLLTAEGELGRWLLVALTAGLSIGVTIWLWRERNREDAIALGMILGGALGNIVDRTRMGYVVDYADLHFGAISPFLVFNVGDAAITIGVLLLIVRALFAREGKSGKEVEDA
jgi:signal peptidase II